MKKAACPQQSSGLFTDCAGNPFQPYQNKKALQVLLPEALFVSAVFNRLQSYRNKGIPRRPGHSP